MAKLIVTIDGPAGSGKSTVGRLLAERLDASFLDTGAMYRAVTLAAMNAGIDMADEQKLLEVLGSSEFEFTAKKEAMAVCIDGVDVSRQIRRPEVTANSRYIASVAKVREKLVQMQRDFAAGRERIVTEGRDQGTVAFPDANVKFFLTADAKERAKRRCSEQQVRGISQSLEQIRKAIDKRDKNDIARDVGPLKQARDAVVVDTTGLSIEEVVNKLSTLVKKNA